MEKSNCQKKCLAREKAEEIILDGIVDLLSSHEDKQV